MAVCIVHLLRERVWFVNSDGLRIAFFCTEDENDNVMDIKKGKLVMLNMIWAAAVLVAFILGGQGEDPDGARSGSKAGAKAGAGHSGSLVSALDRSLSSGKGSAAGGKSSGKVDSRPGTAGRRMVSALSDPDPLRRNARIAELLINLNAGNVAEVLAAFENGPKSEEANRHFRDFMYAWGRLAGEDAIAYAFDSESARRDSRAGTSAMSGWATRDPEGAKEYVAGVKDSGTRQWMHYAVMREMLQNDLDGAIAYSEKNEKSRARGVQMDQLATALLEQRGINGITDWVNGIDHSIEENDMLSYKRYAAGIALDRMAGDDPDAAMQFILDNSEQPFITSDGLERAARRAAGPINEELEWLTQLPAEVSGQRHAIGERFEDYIREDFAAAGQWLASRELGPAYDEAIQDYAFSAARDNREAAIAWAERITDAEIKADTLRRLAPRDQGSKG
ncbi:MAG: hypothetical protein GY899_06890 [Verrucomicrobiaceae bacterium]|nr:hypothetical protein [Verrucomicrobiaceae bacterium]